MLKRSDPVKILIIIAFLVVVSPLFAQQQQDQRITMTRSTFVGVRTAIKAIFKRKIMDAQSELDAALGWAGRMEEKAIQGIFSQIANERRQARVAASITAARKQLIGETKEKLAKETKEKLAKETKEKLAKETKRDIKPVKGGGKNSTGLDKPVNP